MADDAPLGRKPVLPPAIEQEVVDVVCASAERGFGITKSQLLHRVGTLATKMSLKIRLKTACLVKIFERDLASGTQRYHCELLRP